VKVWPNAEIKGFEHVWRSLAIIFERYSHFDLILFLPDSDGKNRATLFGQLEAEHGSKLICCAAVEEVEAWLLAGHTDKFDLPWPNVRADTSVKENIFAPFLRDHGDSRRPGGGREELMQHTLTNLRGLLERCPELAHLQARICEALNPQL
jgi:hypothetical protein